MTPANWLAQLLVWLSAKRKMAELPARLMPESLPIVKRPKACAESWMTMAPPWEEIDWFVMEKGGPPRTKNCGGRMMLPVRLMFGALTVPPLNAYMATPLIQSVLATMCVPPLWLKALDAGYED